MLETAGPGGVCRGKLRYRVDLARTKTMYAKGSRTGEMGLLKPTWFHQEFPVLDIEL